MNRKERRTLEKTKGKSTKMMAPIAPISLEMMKLKHPDLAFALNKFEEKCKLDASNEVFNLIFACVLVALHDKFDFNADQLNKLVSEGIHQLDCVSSGFVTKYDMIGLISELGVKVEDLELEKITHNAQQTHERLKYYLGEVEEMTRKEQAFELFEKGIFDAKVIVEQIGGSEQSIPKYKSLWKQAKLENMSVDEFTEMLLGASNPQKAEVVEKDVIEVTKDAMLVDDHIAEAGEMIEEENKGVKKMGLKKVMKVVSIEGEFATYEPVDQSWDVTIDGQVITLSREQMKVLAEEFEQVAVEGL